MALNNLSPPKSVLWKCRKKVYACRSRYLRDIVEVYEMSRSAVVRKVLDKPGIIIHLRHQKKKKLSWCLAFGLSTSKTEKENISAFLCYPICVICSGSPWRLIHKQINKQLSSFTLKHHLTRLFYSTYKTIWNTNINLWVSLSSS